MDTEWCPSATYNSVNRASLAIGRDRNFTLATLLSTTATQGSKHLDMTPVRSSAIQAVGYDSASRWLRIRFAGGHEYDFYGVPPKAYDGLMSARSKGSYFNDRIRERYRQ